MSVDVYDSRHIALVRNKYYEFILSNRVSDCEFRLTPESDVTPFALCFVLFGLHLMGALSCTELDVDKCADRLRCNLLSYKGERMLASDLRYDKPFLQLLTFTLSALKVINKIEQNPLEDVVRTILTYDVKTYLDHIGSLKGIPQSGNLAMFLVILLIYARDYLDIDTSSQISQWVDLHLDAMNRYGFWGDDKRGMTYLHFQNGYHQFEIFEYLNVQNPYANVAAEKVARLADKEGHFAPYPGGGGCYDYDAVFVLTSADKSTVNRYRHLMLQAAESITREQNPDGGFSESHYIRPRTLNNFKNSFFHVVRNNKSGFNNINERLMYALTLQRNKNNRIHTHWSQYSRRWSESNLWDSWFRMLTLARIQLALERTDSCDWGFIDFPGIGFHHTLRKTS
jgi:hypothetical protein